MFSSYDIGFIAVAAHTVVAKKDREEKVTGRAADVILATYYASQAALRLLKPGTGVSQTSYNLTHKTYRIENL